MAVLGKRNLELGPFASDEAPQDGEAFAHWRLRTDEDGIVWLLFDKKDASVNTLSEDVLTELNATLGKLEQNPPRGVVIRSAKLGGFIAGADISQFRGITDVAQIEAQIARGHAVLDRLDRLPSTTIAVIHGYCLGGGLEVALACDYRIAV
ncbi:MAG: enoyl-CoA hydratase-related protein, partial [Xanthobacteraceae bacterium]